LPPGHQGVPTPSACPSSGSCPGKAVYWKYKILMCLTIPLIDIKPYVPGFDTKAVTSTGWLEKTQEKAQNMKSDTRFVVLLGPLGPVIIDLPQAVDATANNHAEKMME